MQKSSAWSLVLMALLATGCGGSESPSDPHNDGGIADAPGTLDAPFDAPSTTLADCASTCGAGSYCAYPRGPGICPSPGQEAGFCPAGCRGCPPLPPPSCAPMPAACAAQPSCGCLLQSLCQGCGDPKFSSCGYKGGDWIVSCLSC